MVLHAPDAAAVGNPDHDGQRDAAPGPVPQLGQMAGDLLEGRVSEGVELHFHDGPQAVHRHADRGTDDPGLCQRRVEDPIVAELAAAADDPEVAR